MSGTPIHTVCLPIFLIAFIAANVYTAEADPVEYQPWENKKGCCREVGPGKGKHGDNHHDSVVVKMYRKVSQKKALRKCKTACIDSTDCTAIEFFRKGKKSKQTYRCELHTAGINGVTRKSKSCKKATCSILTRTTTSTVTTSTVTRTTGGAPPPPPQGFCTEEIDFQDLTKYPWTSYDASTDSNVIAWYNRSVAGQPLSHFGASCTGNYTATGSDASCSFSSAAAGFVVGSSPGQAPGTARLGINDMTVRGLKGVSGGNSCDGYGSCVGEAALTPVFEFVQGDVIYLDWSAEGSYDDFESAAVLYEASGATGTPNPATDPIIGRLVSRGTKGQTCADFRDRSPNPMELPDFSGTLNVIGCTNAGSWRQYLTVDAGVTLTSGYAYVGFFAGSYDATGLSKLGATVSIESVVRNFAC